MDEKKYIDKLINAIEQKVERGPVSEWTNHYFFLLSCDIEDKTGHRISESTLKRILGKKNTSKRFYNPQVQTKNILANFLGYSNWHTFKSSVHGPGKRETNFSDSGTELTKISGKSIMWLFLIPLLAVILVIVLKKRDHSIFFELDNTESQVPYTAIFNYDISNIRDSVFIDFGNYEKYHLDPPRKMITQFYRSASAPVIKVYTEKGVLAKLKILNISDEWQIGTSPNDTILAYRPFEPQPDFMKADTLYLSMVEREMANLLFDEPRWIEYRKTAEFGLSLDSITFSCALKNNIEIGGKRCFDGEVLLFGSKNDIRLRFMEPGCSRFALIQISEKAHNGRFENLDMFEVDLSQWANIKIQTQANHARISLNENLIFEEDYEQSLGDFWGIVLRFYGNGAAHSVEYSNN